MRSAKANFSRTADGAASAGRLRPGRLDRGGRRDKRRLLLPRFKVPGTLKIKLRREGVFSIAQLDSTTGYADVSWQGRARRLRTVTRSRAQELPTRRIGIRAYGISFRWSRYLKIHVGEPRPAEGPAWEPPSRWSAGQRLPEKARQLERHDEGDDRARLQVKHIEGAAACNAYEHVANVCKITDSVQLTAVPD